MSRYPQQPEYREIPIHLLRRDLSYQNDDRYRAQRAREMANNWNWGQFQSISVNQRTDGSGLYVYDGWHRTQALLLYKSPEYPIPALVAKGTYEDECRWYAAQNINRIGLTAGNSLNALYHAREENAVAIVETCAFWGWRLQYVQETKGKGKGKIKAVSAIVSIYGRGSTGPYVLDTILEVINRSWGHQNGVAEQHILYGLESFIRRYYNQFDKDRLVLVLRENGLQKLEERALRYKPRKFKPSRGEYARFIGWTIYDFYQSGLRQNKLSEWHVILGEEEQGEVA